MTNEQIIYDYATQVAELFTVPQAEQLLKKLGELPLHTFQGWKKRGFIVKKGEKSAHCLKLWKMCKPKKDSDSDSSKMYLVKSYLFTEKQVEPLK